MSLKSFSRYLRTSALPLLASLLLGSCREFVQSVPSPIDLISDKDLANESSLPLVYTGIGGNFATAFGLIAPFSSTLSDEFQSGNGISRDRTRGDIFNLDDGNPERDLTNSVWGRFAGTRFQGKNLLELEPQIRFTQDSNRRRLLFTANFFLATSEHYLASYFGLNARRTGAVIDGSPFIPTTALHDTALKKYTVALANAQTPHERRTVYSLIARIHLLEGRYQQALEAAENGLQEGDSPFLTTYSVSSANPWTNFAGENPATLHSVLPNTRFQAYIEAEPGEAARIPLTVGTRPEVGRTQPYYVQAKFVVNSPIEVTSWQENSLMLAELRLRLSNNVQAALREVNRVRAAVPTLQGVPRLAMRTTTNLDSIYIERDKQFFGKGLRLLDQRRFDRWHFSGANAQKAWHCLPIARNEYTTNPNLQGQ